MAQRDVLVAAADKECEGIRAQVAKENLARELVKERLVKEFWEPMAQPGAQIASLKYEYRSIPGVYNCQILDISIFRSPSY